MNQNDDVSICPSDGKPCTLQCYRGHPARPCDPAKVKPSRQQVPA